MRSYNRDIKPRFRDQERFFKNSDTRDTQTDVKDK